MMVVAVAVAVGTLKGVLGDGADGTVATFLYKITAALPQEGVPIPVVIHANDGRRDSERITHEIIFNQLLWGSKKSFRLFEEPQARNTNVGNSIINTFTFVTDLSACAYINENLVLT